MILNRLLFFITIFCLVICNVSASSFNGFGFIDRSGLTSPYLQVPVYERAQKVVDTTDADDEELEGCCQAEEE